MCIYGNGRFCGLGESFLTFDSFNTLVANDSGFSGVTFSSATPVPFEFSPTEGIVLGLPLFIGLRMLKKKMASKRSKIVIEQRAKA